MNELMNAPQDTSNDPIVPIVHLIISQTLPNAMVN